jgi:transcriptional antiterminator
MEKEKSLTKTQIRTNERKVRVRELILKKLSINDIAHDLELTPNTIVNYIGRLLTDDASLDIEYIKESVEGYKDIVKSFEKHGTEKIGPIYADFGGNVEYADITLVKVLMLSK